jgi:hypothetical protein
MSSVSQFWNRSQTVVRNNERLAAGRIGARIRSCAEYLWLGVTFLLFIFLGPFAAIAVVPAVFSLALQSEGPEPERELSAHESY